MHMERYILVHGKLGQQCLQPYTALSLYECNPLAGLWVEQHKYMFGTSALPQVGWARCTQTRCTSYMLAPGIAATRFLVHVVGLPSVLGQMCTAMLSSIAGRSRNVCHAPVAGA